MAPWTAIAPALAGFTLAGFTLLFAAVAAAEPTPRQIAYGKHLSSECTTCHRIDGTDNGIPSIIGWPADAFVAVLVSYRDGERTNQAMISVAKSLDEEQMGALAAYFGSLQPK